MAGGEGEGGEGEGGEGEKARVRSAPFGSDNQGLALQGIYTPLGSAFNPAVYLYCLSTENKESFSQGHMAAVANGVKNRLRVDRPADF